MPAAAEGNPGEDGETLQQKGGGNMIPSCALGVPIFRMLPTKGLEELGQALQHREVARGEVVAVAGDSVAHLIVVARGRLRLALTTRSGREQTVRILNPGEFLGEMALFAPATYEGDLTALEESSLCFVPRAAIQAMLARHPALAHRLVEALAQRLAEAEQLIGDLSLRDVGQRLAAELLREAQGLQPGPDGIRLQLNTTWAERAVKLGTTPESLSRRLKSLAEQGLIRQPDSRTVIILDAQRLRLMAEQ